MILVTIFEKFRFFRKKILEISNLVKFAINFDFLEILKNFDFSQINEKFKFK